MLVRHLQPSEMGFLMEMLYEALYVPIGNPAYPKEIIYRPEIFKYVKEWGRPYDIAFIAIHEDESVGAIWGRLYTETEKSFGYIDDETPEISVAIIKEYRNKGIGKILIETISKHYVELNIKSLSLSVDKENRALNLYLRTGFKIVGENGTAWTMKKNLRNTL